MPGEKDHSIWVGDLTPEVDDYEFYRFFSARFQSVKSAKGKQQAKSVFYYSKHFHYHS